jgi:hypothetical protein
MMVVTTTLISSSSPSMPPPLPPQLHGSGYVVVEDRIEKHFFFG